MDKELIEHITTKLQNHEEPYSPGSWERFAKKEEKRKRPFYWPLWAAAAIILICGSVFLILNGDKKENVLVKNRPQIENKKRSIEDSDGTSQSAADGDLASSKNNGIVLGKNKSGIYENLSETNTIEQQPLSGLTARLKNDQLDLEAQNLLSSNLTKIDISSAMFKNFEIVTAKKKVESSKKRTFEDLLAQDSKNDQYKKNSKAVENSKWQPGVYVAPSMGNDNKVNMNYGFSLSYNVADKLSINSGIAYSALSSTSLPNAGGSPSSAVADAPASSSIVYSNVPQSTAKSLESVSANVNGISIPLEIRYSFSNKFYSSVGVSALAVLNSKQQNNYVLNQFENRSVTNDMGVAEQRTLVVEKKATETIPESAADPDKYIGFYNFSLGYKQKISKKNSMSVEPFLRLPMKTFSKENLNLTNGGLRLKIDF
ncbi:hypothetical protein [Pedobacter endophyticus]|uniref:Outer membrane protein beta-barrel domain-containing protein n=1 Tax=Pedobacter endophyticus TaxID=2789740 RepID=A0A7S9PZS0_9SPHI|nr:hypothetical protein [Pedobacter endophyticus]QPH40643.1 hypothetical protein IZT61_05045 [Pedobacter endophyticus]